MTAVFFEEITPQHLPLIRLYVWFGTEVLYRNRSRSCQNDPYLIRKENTRSIRRVAFDPPLYLGQNPSTDLAIEHVAAIDAQAFFTRSIRATARLFRDADIAQAYHKTMVEILAQYHYQLLIVEQLLAAGFDHVRIVPRPGNRIESSWDPLLCCIIGNRLRRRCQSTRHSRQVRIARWLYFRSARLFVRKIAEVTVGLVCSWAGSASSLLRGMTHKPQPPIHKDLGIFIVSPLRELRDGVRSIGFLSRHPSLEHISSLYIPMGHRLEPSMVDEIERRGLLVSKWEEVLTLSAFLRISRTMISLILSMDSLWKLWVSAHLLRVYIRWTSFLQYYHCSCVVSYADFAFQHIGRNVLLQQNGIETWYYNDSINMGKWISERTYFTPLRYPFWCDMHYDHLVTSNDRIARYLQGHPNPCRTAHVVGSLWGSHLCQLRTRQHTSKYWEPLRSSGYREGQKVVVLFDSWYHPDGMNSASDLVSFVTDFIRFVETNPLGIFLVLKEKNPRGAVYRLHDPMECDTIFATHEALNLHPNGCVLDHTHDPSDVSAIADLVVSFPFTSATYECLSSGIKSVYYDPADKFRGTYYDRYSRLVIHGYEELAEFLPGLLDEPDSTFFERLADETPTSTELNLTPDGLDSFCRLLADSIAERKLAPTKTAE